jgi:hypothetical protein
MLFYTHDRESMGNNQDCQTTRISVCSLLEKPIKIDSQTSVSKQGTKNSLNSIHQVISAH